MLSIVYEALSENELIVLLNKIGVRPEDDDKFSGRQIRSLRTRLQQAGLLHVQRNGLLSIDRDYTEDITRYASARPDFNYLISEIRRELPYKTYWQPLNRDAMLREVRMAFYTQNAAQYDRLMEEAQMFFPRESEQGYFTKRLFAHFDPDWIDQQPVSWQVISLQENWRDVQAELGDPQPIIDFMEGSELLREPEGSDLRLLLSEIYFLRGQKSRLQAILEFEDQSSHRELWQGLLNLVGARDLMALDQLESARKAFKRQGKVHLFFPSRLADYLYLVGHLRAQGLRAMNLLQEVQKILRKNGGPSELHSMVAVMHFLRNEDSSVRSLMREHEPNWHSGLSLLAWGLASVWTGYRVSDKLLEELETARQHCAENGYRWLEMELTRVLSRVHPIPELASRYLGNAEKLSEELGVSSLIDVLPQVEDWERALEMLQSLSNQNGRKKTTERRTRLVWFVDFENEALELREQSLSKGGSWSKGRKVALKRLRTGEVDNLLPQDLAAAKAIQEEYNGYGFNSSLSIDFGKAMLELVGHPHLFLIENPSINVQLLRSEPTLLIEETEDGLEIRFDKPVSDRGIQVIRETPTRYLVVEIEDKHAQIARQIGDGLRVPKRARHKVESVSRELKKLVPVQSTLTGTIEDLDARAGDTKICVHLLPMGEGFKIEFFVKPFGAEPPYFKPGAGRARVAAEIDGHRQLADRDLELERRRAAAVVAACPTLERLPATEYEWTIDEVEDCLNVLLELQPLRNEDKITLEHPRGEKVRLLGQVDFGDLSLGVTGNKEWFNVNGELRIDEQRVLSFQDLLESIRRNGEDSDFVELSEGQYVALTDRLRRKLQEIESMLEQKKNEFRLHPLASGILEDIAPELGDFQTDLAWAETQQRLSDAQVFTPRVPSTFRAELRPYQLDGFRWLMRLSAWGVGACLADDMGLGKTIQALAALSARAETGPALVIAPASVTRNWLREAHKFTPTLRPHVLGPGNRQEVIDSMGNYDILIVSYGLLPFEGDSLALKKFGTIILDEAQAIKNRSTKRSKIVMQLQGDFKMVTTGTPIENHLGELWNLFNFLNPGLLGSHDRFNERFTVPITRDNNKLKRQQLRRILQPFILRRRKEEVLEELPPKTEVNLSVELSPEEFSFYEALRRNALEAIDSSDGPQRRFAVLAQLTKLRQAACHPRLVRPDIDLPSAKLELVQEIVKELIDSNHKALIFSQFVRHLQIVEEWVKAAGISYQYLDGSTPGKKRDDAVQAFQRGEGDLFLISLKAGGTGLTLTAADYVLHLDPWWNPAVEDQASDRVHRIGQQRPVTVYRFVSENTIEEKIVKLHAEKRDLADSLLAGTESSAALSTEDLLDLIRQA